MFEVGEGGRCNPYVKGFELIIKIIMFFKPHLFYHILKAKRYRQSCHKNCILIFEPCDANTIDVEEESGNPQVLLNIDNDGFNSMSVVHDNLRYFVGKHDNPHNSA